MRPYLSSFLIALGLGLTLPNAGNAQDLTSSLMGCRDINDDSDRLACFDNLVGAMGTQAVAQAPASAQAPVEPAAPVVVLTAEERFGVDDLRKSDEVKKREKKTQLQSLSDSVVDIARNGRGKYVVILENGQIWRQLNADSGRLRIPKSGAEGMTVEIKRRSLGAHSLYLAGENRGIKVERIK